MIKAALIGCGKIGSSFADDPKVKGVYAHAHAYSRVDGIALSAVCDNDIDKARHCAVRWGGVLAFSDVAELLADVQPEIVSVCTPDETHVEILEKVLLTSSVKAVLAEKPLAVSFDDATRLVKLAKQKNIHLAVNYSRRYSRSHQLLRCQLADRIGVVQCVHGYYTKGLLHNGTHWLDLIRFLFGSVTVTSCVAGLSPFPGDPVGDSSPSVTLSLGNGAPVFLVGLDAAQFSIFEMEIIGSKGRVRLLDSGFNFEWQQVTDSQYFSGYTTLAPGISESADMQDLTLNALTDLLASVQESREPLCSGEDALAAQALVKQARSFLSA